MTFLQFRRARRRSVEDLKASQPSTLGPPSWTSPSPSAPTQTPTPRASSSCTSIGISFPFPLTMDGCAQEFASGARLRRNRHGLGPRRTTPPHATTPRLASITSRTSPTCTPISCSFRTSTRPTRTPPPELENASPCRLASSTDRPPQRRDKDHFVRRQAWQMIVREKTQRATQRREEAPRQRDAPEEAQGHRDHRGRKAPSTRSRPAPRGVRHRVGLREGGRRDQRLLYEEMAGRRRASAILHTKHRLLDMVLRRGHRQGYIILAPQRSMRRMRHQRSRLHDEGQGDRADMPPD